MGTTRSRIEEALFTRTQARVLGILFNEPDRSFYLSEILSSASVGSGSVRRELERLVSAGLVERRNTGNRVHYQADRRSPVFDELRGLVMKTTSAGMSQANALRAKLPAALCRKHAVKRLTLFGSAARGDATPASDLDFMVEFEPGRSPTLSGLELLKHALETLYGRRVDLATTAILDNPYRRKMITKDMEVIYERKGPRTPVGHARGRA